MSPPTYILLLFAKLAIPLNDKFAFIDTSLLVIINPCVRVIPPIVKLLEDKSPIAVVWPFKTVFPNTKTLELNETSPALDTINPLFSVANPLAVIVLAVISLDTERLALMVVFPPTFKMLLSETSPPPIKVPLVLTVPLEMKLLADISPNIFTFWLNVVFPDINAFPLNDASPLETSNPPFNCVPRVI